MSLKCFVYLENLFWAIYVKNRFPKALFLKIYGFECCECAKMRTFLEFKLRGLCQ